MDEIPREISTNSTPSVSPPQRGGEEKDGKGEPVLWYLQREFKVGVGVLLALAAACVLIFGLLPMRRGTPQGVAEETYTLVRDKISKSAAIALALPKGMTMTPEEAPEKVTFEPALEGKWTVGGNPKELFFTPSAKLVQGNYYTVSLQTADGTLSKDFLVDEDPAILSIFPRAKSEAHENSDIAIVFNRPMVPLTTLDVLDERNIPVEITPATKGKFKWISPRNLQFIPETHLIRSANYTVSVKNGFISMDGLPAKGVAHTFTTRPLRYQDEPAPNQPILYNEPSIIRFNQPVDLERTRQEILVTKLNGPDVPIIVEYGTRTLYEDGAEKEYIDKSALAIFSAADRNGRPKFWDFNTVYTVTVAKVYPAEGEIMVDQKRSYGFNVPEVVQELSATSPRSDKVTADIFDPKGTLLVRFYEEVDKDATSISAPHLRDVVYGERCKTDENGNPIYTGGVCEKEPDMSVLALSFDKDGFGNAQQIPLTFRKIVNSKGVSLLSEPLTKTITTFPRLAIRATSPENGTKNSELNVLRVCSNTPLQMPEEKDFYNKVKSTITIGKWNWNESYRVSIPNPQSPCASGEFETGIRYGLIPETNYALSLSLTDHFGQTTSKELSFFSGKIPQMYRRITPLQKAYNVTSPERTKLVYGIENLEYVDAHICKVSAQAMAQYLSGENAKSATIAGENLACLQSWRKRIDLPKRYWSMNYLTFDLHDVVGEPLGHYIVSLSHPDYRQTNYDYRTKKYSEGMPVYERAFLTVTNLAVQEKKIEDNEYTMDENPALTDKVRRESKGNLYWVTSFGTLAPVAGALVDLYQKDGVSVSGGRTNAEGIARTPVGARVTTAIVTAGEDSAIVSNQIDKFEWAQALASAQKTYIYTDRPIYRPNEEVNLKGLYRIGYDGEYEIVPDRKADIVIYDSRGEKVSTNQADVSENGTFTSKLMLSKTAPLGMYRIDALGGYGYFEVQEYVPSAFKVDVASAKEEYVAGDKMELTVDAAYYFGVPLEAGDSVEYSILAQDYYFDRYTDGYFRFGKSWYYGEYAGYGDRFVTRGKTTLNSKGQALIEQPLDFEKYFKGTEHDEGTTDRSKIFTVNITVKNKQGQTVSAQKSLIVHRGSVYLGANMERRYFGKGEQNKILVKSVDIHGKPVSQGGIEASIYKITWESFKRQEVDGRFYYHSTKKKDLVKRLKLSTNSSGDDDAAFTLDEAGEYELHARANDRAGNPVVSSLDFYVYGGGAVSVRPANNETLELAVDKSTLKVGETANVIIKSPFEKGKALVTVERGRVFDYQVIDVNQNLTSIGVPMRPEYLPNIYFSVILLSPRPEVKYGQIQFKIAAAEKELSISVRSDKKNYLPGEKVRLAVETRDASGVGVPAEVSIAVADMSVLALKGNPKQNPVAFFYAGFPLGVATASNIKNILYEADVPKGTKGGGGGETLAKKKRGDFRSTALWQGVMETNARGIAEVSFTLPDNLTTWQSEVLGITKDTKVGVGYSELTTRKEVMVTPLKPRFVVPGDTFKLGAKVFNQSGETVRFNVGAESATLLLTGTKNTNVSIRPGESAAVYFDAKAPESMEMGIHTFTISAEGENLLDSMEDTIAITRNDTYESVATSFSTSKEKAREYVFLPENVVKDKGALTITANATLSLYLSDALRYLVGYPYGCSEQIASKLSAIAVQRRAYAAKNDLKTFNETKVNFDGQSYTPQDLIDIGLARVYANQATDGGFTYYAGMQTNFYLTVHVLNTLLDLRAAQYDVKTDVLQSAAKYVGTAALYEDRYRKDSDTVIIAAYALERASEVTGAWNPLHHRVTEIAGTRAFVQETGSNLSLGYLALILSRDSYGTWLRDGVLRTLENRLSVDGRGAFMKTGDRRIMYDYYQTPIKDTALLLRAWVAAKKDHELTDKVLRWLLKSRSKDGSWGSTNNTLSAVEAFTDYIEWKKEDDSNFELSILTDGIRKSSFIFDRTTNEKTTALTIPVADISKGIMHTIDFVKKNLNTLPNTFYYDLSLKYFLPINSVPARDEGFAVERSLYAFADAKRERPVLSATVGEVLRGVLRVTVPKERRFVSIENFIPAGTELVNFTLSTEDQSLQSDRGISPYGRGGAREAAGKSFAAVFGLGSTAELPDEAYSGTIQTRERLYADAEETHDDRVFLFKENLSAGVYEYTYFVRALVPGVFNHLPAVVSELYFPENFGRTRGEYFTITR